MTTGSENTFEGAPTREHGMSRVSQAGPQGPAIVWVSQTVRGDLHPHMQVSELNAPGSFKTTVGKYIVR